VGEVGLDVWRVARLADVSENDAALFRCGVLRREAMLFVLLYDCRHTSGCNVFNEVVIDECNGALPQLARQLDELDAEFAISCGGWCAAETMMLLVRIESHGLAEFFLHLVAASEGAGERAAHADDRFSGLLASEPRIKSHQFQDVHWRQVELGGDPFDACVVNEAEVVLPEVQQG
jgi:hypothetical protein